MDLLRICISALAVWRVTHLLQTEDGPFEVLAAIRSGVRQASLAGLADCFYCLSLWLAAPISFYLGSSWLDRMVLWPALSGAAIFLNRFAESMLSVPSYYEEPTQKEKHQCSVVEMPKNFQPGILRLTPEPSEYTILSSVPLYSGTQAQRG